MTVFPENNNDSHTIPFCPCSDSHSTMVTFSQVCQKKTDATCGKQIVRSIFQNIGNVSEKCCNNLLWLGEECHNTLVERQIAACGYEKQVVAVIKRSFWEWNRCGSLASCMRMTDPTCGKDFVAKVYHNKGEVGRGAADCLFRRGRDAAPCSLAIISFPVDRRRMLPWLSAALRDKCHLIN